MCVQYRQELTRLKFAERTNTPMNGVQLVNRTTSKEREPEREILESFLEIMYRLPVEIHGKFCF